MAAPAAASAGVPTAGSPTGGAGLTGGPGPAVHRANATVTATGSGVTIQTHASAILRRSMTFTGTAGTSAAGETVEIDRLGHQTGWSWVATTSATVAADGSFSAVWRTNHIGRFSIRAILLPAGTATPATLTTTPAAATSSMSVTVYRRSLATEYGPGFYGSTTACGEKLTRSMLGVANRTLRCGMKVAIDYRGKTMIVPVIDRGPYANGADWDLTMATGAALGMDGTAKIGAVSLPTR
jgi:peptidoglycan lytic transglycosylase